MAFPRIAFLGLGIMGGGMAGRLLGAGFSVTVWNRHRARAEALAAAGARIADTPCAAAKGADVVLAMVADDIASRTIWLGVDGALAGARPGALLVECSTLTVGWVKELAAAAQARGCAFADAPVTGSKAAAAAGELSFLVGGEAPVVERLRPVLAPMSRRITHFGPVGSGARMKLVNNFAAAVQVCAFAEALDWVERSGLDRDQAVSFLLEAAPGSPILKLMAPRMTARDYAPNFLLRLMAKDLGYAVGQAEADGVRLETGAMAHRFYQRAVAAGFGDQDMAAVVEPLRSGRAK